MDYVTPKSYSNLPKNRTPVTANDIYIFMAGFFSTDER